MVHFDKLQTPLRAVQRYPSTKDQHARFKRLGWPIVSTCNLWELWGSSHFASSSERNELDRIEPFDEWEEFALFGCHYILLTADNGFELSQQTLSTASTIRELPSMPAGNPRATSQLQMSYEEYPRARGCNRFAAAMQISHHVRSRDAIAVFGGMGLVTRMNSMEIYSNDENITSPVRQNVAPAIPSSRMCHTLTDIGDEGAVLIGGRTSPNRALADCWFFHKW
jgi:tRNA wybutosine-synthesizing protein 4